MEAVIFLNLLNNISLLVALSIVHSLIVRRWKKGTTMPRILSGMLFGIVAIVGMATPVRLLPGIIFDGRSIVISVAGLFGGPVAGVVAAVIAATYRLRLGGAGAIMGVSVITASACIGIAYHYLRRRWPGLTAPWYLLAFGLVVHFVMLLLTATLPGAVSKDVLRQIAFPVMTIYPVGSLLICMLFLDQESRLAAQEQLRAREAEMRSMLAAEPTGVALVSGNTLRTVNQHFCRITGYAENELVGQDMRMLYGDDQEFARVGRELYDRVRQHGLGETEARWRRKDGKTIDVLLGSSPIDPGNLSAGLATTALDITERRRIEAEMERLRRLLANIIDSMPSVLVGVDPEGRVTNWNREAQLASGVAAQDALGRPLDAVLPHLAGQMEKIATAIRERSVVRSEKVRLPRNGEARVADIMIYPLTTNGVEGAVIRVDDVTDRVRIEEMMIQSEKMASVGGLAAGAAHEINNPLGVILQGVQNIDRRTSLELPQNAAAAAECGTSLEAIRAYLEKRDIRTMLDSIRTAGERAARIVANMLQFSRRGPLELTPACLPELIDRALDLAASDYDIRKRYDFRRIEIVREYAPDLPAVPCSAPEIEQVLLNLLKNAAQALAGAERPEPPRIVVRTRREGAYARIEVEDNGPGMSEKVRRRVFEPFFTTKEAGVGTGLGLSVSYMIVTSNHKGTISAESEPGRGARFIVRLPLERNVP